LSYISVAGFLSTYPFAHIPYFLLTGLWLTVLGFFLCIVSGFLEWRYPTAAGIRVNPQAKPSVGRTPPYGVPANPTARTIKPPAPQRESRDIRGTQNPGPKDTGPAPPASMTSEKRISSE
ncbi:MAG: hypothetical protein JSW28_02915, partial [Thermoplasmata archaeon]